MNYNKRIAFLISSQHFHMSGGIGQFAKSFCEMANKFNWLVDIILDKAPASRRDSLEQYFKDKNINILFPDDPVSYSRHTQLYQFGDSINLEKIQNFQESLLIALRKYYYDVILCNTPESLPATYYLDLADSTKIINYTHIENTVLFDKKSNDTFLDCHTNFIRSMADWPGVITGTQSEYNMEEIKKHHLKADVRWLPMPVPELGLLDLEFPKKEGILFIGRHEERKQPAIFIKLLAETGLPGLILTGPRSEDKWIEDLEKAGVTNYEIKAGIIGEEKVKFIKKAKLAFHPSLRESYGFSAFETLHSCPTFLLKENVWWNNFKNFTGLCLTSKETMVQNILNEYNKDYDYELLVNQMQKYHNTELPEYWKNIIDKNETKNIKTNNLFFKFLENKNYWVSLTEYYNDLNHKKIRQDEAWVMQNRLKSDKISIYQDKDNTYVSLDKNPIFKNSSISTFFEFE